MKCVICKTGATQPGATTVTLERCTTTVVIKGVPADVCDNCGEYYLSEDVAAQVEDLAEAAVSHGAEVEVLRYAPASV